MMSMIIGDDVEYNYDDLYRIWQYHDDVWWGSISKMIIDAYNSDYDDKKAIGDDKNDNIYWYRGWWYCSYFISLLKYRISVISYN